MIIKSRFQKSFNLKNKQNIRTWWTRTKETLEIHESRILIIIHRREHFLGLLIRGKNALKYSDMSICNITCWAIEVI